MKVVQIDYHNITPKVENLSIILGYFDGVHLGHKSLIEFARKHAKYPLAILTFSRPVASLMNNGKTKEVLTSLPDRFKIISKLGVDYYYLFHINKDFLNLSDIDFIEILKKLNVKEVFVGKDFTFGKNRSGTANTLQDFFSTNICDLLEINGEKVSAQNIKNLLELGKIKEANKLLGYNYQINGTVVHGNGIGHTIGFPTLNIKLADNYLLPRYGVYKTIVYIDNVPHLSITNVGVKPTIDMNNLPNIEVHVKNYEDDGYSKNVMVEFLEFIRPERKFSSIEELKNQIDHDVKQVFGLN